MVKRLSLLLVLLLVSVDARGQWVQLAWPYGGRVNSFVADSISGNVYAATNCGVWISRDHLQSWSLFGMQGQYVLEILEFRDASNREVVFATGGIPGNPGYPGALYRSSDGGAQWDNVSIHPPYGGYIHSLFAYGKEVFILAQALDSAGNTGVAHTTDLGASWEIDQNPVESGVQTIEAATISGDYLVVMTAYSVWRKSAQGGIWTKLGGLPKYYGWTFASDGDVLYSVGGLVSISTDHGQTWITPTNSGLKLDAANSSLVAKGNILIASDENGTWRSTDGAKSWTQMEGKAGFPTLYYSARSTASAYVDGSFVAGTVAGIMTSPDAVTWQYHSDGMSNMEVSDVASLNASLFASTPRGVYRSTDQGVSWIIPLDSLQLTDDVPGSLIKVDSSLFHASLTGLWEWNGAFWTRLSSAYTHSISLDSKYLYGSFDDSGVRRSTDNGKTWVLSNAGLPVSPNNASKTNTIFTCGSRVLVEVAEYFGDSDFLSPEMRIYASDDHATSWYPVLDSNGFSNTSFVFAYSSLYLGANEYSFQSSDSGSHWKRGKYDSGPRFIRPFESGVAMVDQSLPTNLSYVFKDGSSKVLVAGDSTYAIRGVTTDDKYAYIATHGRGIWRTELANISLAVTTTRPNDFEPLTIFPNPLTTKTTIAFSLPERAHVSLKLYDELGILRSIIFDGEREAGAVEIPFEDRTMANGVYTVVLSTPIKSAVVRLLIAR